MFCPNCGNNVQNGDVFCTSCGFKLNSNPDRQPTPTHEPAYNADAPTCAPDYNNSASNHASDYDNNTTTYAPDYNSDASTHTMDSPTAYAYRHTSTPKPSGGAKKIVSLILILAIIGSVVFSFFTFKGINGKWAFNKMLINDKDAIKAIEEIAQNQGIPSEETPQELVDKMYENFDDYEMEFTSDQATLKANGKKDKGPYEIKDGVLYVRDEYIGNIDYSFFELKLTVNSADSSEFSGMSAYGFETVAMVLHRDWVQLLIHGGILLALIIALIITLLTGRKSSKKPGNTIGATYDLSVNPTSDLPDTPYTPVETSDTTASYVAVQEPTPKTFNDYAPINTDPILPNVKTPSDSADMHSATYAKPMPGIYENVYKNCEAFETKYASKPDVAQKSVEIVFDVENNIPSITPDEYNFAPGTSGVSATPETAAVETPMVSEPSVAFEDPVAPKVSMPSEAPATSATPATPGVSAPTENNEPKSAPSPFFKSAGDL